MDKGLPDSYDTKIYEKNVNVVFQHIYDYYDGDSHNIIKQQHEKIKIELTSNVSKRGFYIFLFLKHFYFPKRFYNQSFLAL